MSALAYIHQSIIPLTLSMLPAKMDTPAARVMLVAIGLQESRFTHREQIGGPAHGFWQFEAGGGVKGVLSHEASRPHILPILETLSYDDAGAECYSAIVDNDILACAFARLLLWTHPKPLPPRTDVEGAWRYYLATWRPGKLHRDTWGDFYERAWAMVADG